MITKLFDKLYSLGWVKKLVLRAFERVVGLELQSGYSLLLDLIADERKWVTYLSRKEGVLESLLSDLDFQYKLLENREVCELILDDDAWWANVASSQELFGKYLNHFDHLGAVLGGDKMFLKLISMDELRGRMFNSEYLLELLLEDQQWFARLKNNKKFCESIVSSVSVANRFLSTPNFLQLAIQDDAFLARMLGEEDAMVIITRMLMGNSSFLYLVGDSPEYIKALVESPQMVSRLIESESFRTVFSAQVSEDVGILFQLIGRSLLNRVIVSDRRMVELLLSEQEVLNAAVRDEIFAIKLVKDIFQKWEDRKHLLVAEGGLVELLTRDERTLLCILKAPYVLDFMMREVFDELLIALQRFAHGGDRDDWSFSEVYKVLEVVVPSLEAMELSTPDIGILTELFCPSMLVSMALHSDEALDAFEKSEGFSKSMSSRVSYVIRLLEYSQIKDWAETEVKRVAGVLGSETVLKMVEWNESVIDSVDGVCSIVGSIGFNDWGVDDFKAFAASLGGNVIVRAIVANPDVSGYLATSESFICDLSQRDEFVRLLISTVLSRSGEREQLVAGERGIVERLLDDETALSRIVRSKKVRDRIRSSSLFLNEVRSDVAYIASLIEENSALVHVYRKLNNVAFVKDVVELYDFVELTRRFIDWSKVFEGKPLQDMVRALSGRGKSKYFLLDLIREGKVARIAGMEIQYPDKNSLWTLVHEVFVEEDYFFESASESPVIIDCGAHVGFSICYFKWLYPNAKITAFEPVTENFNLLRDNVERNSMKDVRIFNLALGRDDCDDDFYLSETDSMAGSCLDFNKGRAIKMRYDKLSKYMNGDIDFLKMDIEGAEWEVLEEIKPKLQQVKNLYIEMHLAGESDYERLWRVVEGLLELDFAIRSKDTFWDVVNGRSRTINAVGKRKTIGLFAKRVR